MKLKPTLVISLCLNLALAGAAVHRVLKTVSPMAGVAAVTSLETTVPAASNSPPSITCVTNRFAWRQIEAEDFEQLATNLRAIGCPEKTVRDVVVARAQRALEQVSDSAESKLPFWTAGLRRARADREAERQAGLARQQIRARAERVVGLEVFLGDEEWADELEAQAIARFIAGPLPDETLLKGVAIIVWFSSQQDELHSRSGGVWLDTDEAELAQLRAQVRRQIAAVLTPAQLEELTARVAMLTLVGKVRFDATDLNIAEVRRLALLYAQFTDPLSDHCLWDGSLTDEQEKQMAMAARQFLGEARFAQFERAADRDFQRLFEMSLDHHLPRDAAAKVFELRQLAVQEARQLQEDPSLSVLDREQRLAQMQAEAQQAALQVLGATACSQYLRSGGAWLTNFNRL